MLRIQYLSKFVQGTIQIFEHTNSYWAILSNARVLFRNTAHATLIKLYRCTDHLIGGKSNAQEKFPVFKITLGLIPSFLDVSLQHFYLVSPRANWCTSGTLCIGRN